MSEHAWNWSKIKWRFNLKNDKYNVIIVGGGFSGIVAADILSGKGLSILMIDENFHSGGQLLRKISEELGVNKKYKTTYIKRVGAEFLKKIKEEDIDILKNSIVLGVYDKNEILIEVENNKVKKFHYDVLLFATGARERFLPFKGWTLPGVISTGMSQVLMKSYGILPSKKIIVAGSGLFLFSVTYELLKNGAKVISLLESTPFLNKVKLLPSLLHAPSKAVEGMVYLSKILLSAVPVKYNSRVIEARGGNTLEEVIIAKTDMNGNVKKGSEKIIRTDSLAIGFGFSPNVGLPSLAGCKLDFIRSLGGWIVSVNDDMETSVKDIYSAGEITGIGGAIKSINEGRIAALSILKKFGKSEEADYKRKIKKLKKERKNNLVFSKYFNTLYGIREDDIRAISNDTVICRCEDVKMGEIKEALKSGFITPGALKLSVRAGMGNCQGRTCGPIIYDLLSISSDANSMKPFSTRPPVKPVNIRNFVE